MKLITTNKSKTKSVKNLCKKGFNNDRVIVYRRHNSFKEEYAFLRRVSETHVGFVSLIGGAEYSPCLVFPTYKQAVTVAAKIRKLYVFKNMEDFMKNRHKMEM